MNCSKSTYDYENQTPFPGVWKNPEITSILREGWYDYGARNYDPQLGMWFNVDPMAEMYTSKSPYNYCMNDPVNNIDPNGMYVVKMATGGGIEGGGGAGGGGGYGGPSGWGGNGGRDVYTPERNTRNSYSNDRWNLGRIDGTMSDWLYWSHNFRGKGSKDYLDWTYGVNEVQKALDNGSLTRTSFSAPDENGRIFSITESRGKFFAAAIITPIEYFEMPSDPGTMYAGPGGYGKIDLRKSENPFKDVLDYMAAAYQEWNNYEKGTYIGTKLEDHFYMRAPVNGRWNFILHQEKKGVMIFGNSEMEIQMSFDPFQKINHFSQFGHKDHGKIVWWDVYLAAPKVGTERHEIIRIRLYNEDDYLKILDRIYGN